MRTRAEAYERKKSEFKRSGCLPAAREGESAKVENFFTMSAGLSGGVICCIGQLIKDFGSNALGMDEKLCAAFTAIVLVFLGALLTGLGVYDRIGAWAGAGSVVPITGFANSIVSPAMEFKREGLTLGTAAKMFTIAGPVLVYGIGSSIIVGLIYCLIRAL